MGERAPISRRALLIGTAALAADVLTACAPQSADNQTRSPQGTPSAPGETPTALTTGTPTTLGRITSTPDLSGMSTRSAAPPQTGISATPGARGTVAENSTFSPATPVDKTNTAETQEIMRDLNTFRSVFRNPNDPAVKNAENSFVSLKKITELTVGGTDHDGEQLVPKDLRSGDDRWVFKRIYHPNDKNVPGVTGRFDEIITKFPLDGSGVPVFSPGFGHVPGNIMTEDTANKRIPDVLNPKIMSGEMDIREVDTSIPGTWQNPPAHPLTREYVLHMKGGGTFSPVMVNKATNDVTVSFFVRSANGPVL